MKNKLAIEGLISDIYTQLDNGWTSMMKKNDFSNQMMDKLAENFVQRSKDRIQSGGLGGKGFIRRKTRKSVIPPATITAMSNKNRNRGRPAELQAPKVRANSNPSSPKLKEKDSEYNPLLIVSDYKSLVSSPQNKAVQDECTIQIMPARYEFDHITIDVKNKNPMVNSERVPIVLSEKA